MDTESAPMFSLVSGEGDGFMLGVAAGDSAGGAWELGYSSVTEQVTVISYRLIEDRRLDVGELVKGLRELDGSEDGDPVYRSETQHFRAWLDRAAAGPPMPESDPSLDGVARSVPLGVAFRRDPKSVTWEAMELGRLFAADAGSIAAAVVSATAVAASCFGQSGRDLIAGVKETVEPVLATIAADAESGSRLETLGDEFDRAISSVGIVSGESAMSVVGGDRSDPLQVMLAGLLLAAPATDRAHVPVEQAARIGGSVLGAAVGGIMGARVGIRAWPWAFANDTWFAEIGRRVVRGPEEIRDLPIPYAVEQHLITGTHPGFH
ncbi:MAG: ADP-ribosylglycohydrolase family protein [Actinomycetota bacterium]|nr:ADP-ribosylglycohydrolase family protein [Actinomycetota bacterium]